MPGIAAYSVDGDRAPLGDVGCRQIEIAAGSLDRSPRGDGAGVATVDRPLRRQDHQAAIADLAEDRPGHDPNAPTTHEGGLRRSCPAIAATSPCRPPRRRRPAGW